MHTLVLLNLFKLQALLQNFLKFSNTPSKKLISIYYINIIALCYELKYTILIRVYSPYCKAAVARWSWTSCLQLRQIRQWP